MYKMIPTILSGGTGSRLWPVSRLTRPKPFLQLADGQSLLQKAFLRGLALPHVVEVLNVTNRDLFFQTDDELRPINTKHCFTRFILEPVGRNTAAACIAASLEVQKAHGDDALLLVLPADHLIANQPAFEKAVAQAVTFAQRGSASNAKAESRLTRPPISCGTVNASTTKESALIARIADNSKPNAPPSSAPAMG